MHQGTDNTIPCEHEIFTQQGPTKSTRQTARLRPTTQQVRPEKVKRARSVKIRNDLKAENNSQASLQRWTS